MITLAFYVGPGDFFDKLIRWRTNSRTSHCELIFSDGLSFSSSPREGGVRFKRIDYDSEPDHWHFVELPDVEEKAVREEAEVLAHSGAKYDWRGVLNFFAGRRAADESRWFCSEICCYLAQVGGAFRFLDDFGISPDRLLAMSESRLELFNSLYSSNSGIKFCEDMANTIQTLQNHGVSECSYSDVESFHNDYKDLLK